MIILETIGTFLLGVLAVIGHHQVTIGVLSLDLSIILSNIAPLEVSDHSSMEDSGSKV